MIPAVPFSRYCGWHRQTFSLLTVPYIQRYRQRCIPYAITIMLLHHPHTTSWSLDACLLSCFSLISLRCVPDFEDITGVLKERISSMYFSDVIQIVRSHLIRLQLCLWSYKLTLRLWFCEMGWRRQFKHFELFFIPYSMQGIHWSLMTQYM